jgi:hypothetical protein
MRVPPVDGDSPQANDDLFAASAHKAYKVSRARRQPIFEISFHFFL